MRDYCWVRVAPCATVPLREGRAVQLGPYDIAIFNLGDRFAAVDNRCPHSGGPLCDGIVSGRSVVCPLHAWRIDVCDGRVVRPGGQDAARVTTYPVRVVDGVVTIGLPHMSRLVSEHVMQT